METSDISFVDLDSEIAHISQTIEIFPEASVKRELVNNFPTVFVHFRKCLCLKVVLQTDYPKVWPISHKMLAYEISNNIKPERQTGLKEFLMRQEATFNSIIDSTSYGKCCIHKMVDVTISALADDMTLCESLDVLETQSKNKQLVENEFSRSLIVGDHVVYEPTSSAESSPKPLRKNASTIKSADSNSKKLKGKSQKKAAVVVEEDDAQKGKFRGADYIFDRIKWYDSIDTDQVVIGYLDRFLGVK